MKFVIYGVGAIGGAIGAALSLSGAEVVGIARGARQAAIAERGLLLRTPDDARRARFPCVSDPAEIAFGPEDAILLTMKTQDTLAALMRLRSAGVTRQPIFCVQNGVSNEPLALRRFAEVHAVTVRMPTFVTAPDDVCAFSVPKHGICDIGRYPSGSNAHDDRLAEALRRADIGADVWPDVMAWKHGKLLFNLHNALEAILGRGVDCARLHACVRAEGEAVLRAAGIPWHPVESVDPRRDAMMRFRPIDGVSYDGGSTTQSLVRGAGSVETDYINGEIALLGRLHGVAAPLNGFLADLVADFAERRVRPGSLGNAELEARVAARGIALPA